MKQAILITANIEAADSLKLPLRDALDKLGKKKGLPVYVEFEGETLAVNTKRNLPLSSLEALKGELSGVCEIQVCELRRKEEDSTAVED